MVALQLEHGGSSSSSSKQNRAPLLQRLRGVLEGWSPELLAIALGACGRVWCVGGSGERGVGGEWVGGWVGGGGLEGAGGGGQEQGVPLMVGLQLEHGGSSSSSSSSKQHRAPLLQELKACWRVGVQSCWQLLWVRLLWGILGEGPGGGGGGGVCVCGGGVGDE